MTYEEWELIDKALEGYFPRTYQLPAESKVIWWAELQGYDAAAVRQAARTLARTVEAFPSLAQLITAIEGDASDHAALAWEEVTAKASELVYPKHGRRPDGSFGIVPVEWHDPYALAALDAVGGARSYLEAEASTIGVMRKHFTNAYEAVVAGAKRAGNYTPPPPREPKQALPAPPPPPALPAPSEIAPMPADFPAAWRRILTVDPEAKRLADPRPEGMRTIAEKQAPGGKVIRLADVVKNREEQP